jgi:hypothetical protein
MKTRAKQVTRNMYVQYVYNRYTKTDERCPCSRGERSVCTVAMIDWCLMLLLEYLYYYYYHKCFMHELQSIDPSI